MHTLTIKIKYDVTGSIWGVTIITENGEELDYSLDHLASLIAFNVLDALIALSGDVDKTLSDADLTDGDLP